MSARSSERLRTEQPDEIKETASAPIAAVSTRRARRKRDASDEPHQASESATPAAAASSAASSVSDSKRPRRGSRARSSASAASEKEEKQGADDDGTKDPPAGSESDESSASENEGQGSSDDEDADAAMTDATDSSLDSLRVGTAGHMFAAATVAGRPALPLLAVARVCDFLSAADIVLRLAPTARASYATAVEYAPMVAQTAASVSDAEAPAESKKQSSRKRGGESRAAATAVATEPFSTALSAARCSIGHRAEVSVFTSARALTFLCASRLRSIVSGIRTRSAKQGEEMFPFDARLLGRISDAIPTLASLHCQLSSSSVQPAFNFPVGLRELDLSLVFFVAPYVPSAKRRSRFTKLAQSWTMTQCDAFAEWAVCKAAALPSLTTLTLSTCASRCSLPWGSQRAAGAAVASPKPSWIEPLISTPSLRHFTCDLDPTKGHWATVADWPATLKQLVQLETFDGTMVQAHLTAMLQAPQHFNRLMRIPLQTVQLTPVLLQSLKGLSRSLTDLRPHSLANLNDISFLRDFAQLRHLDLFDPASEPPPYSYLTVTYNVGAAVPAAQHIVETIEALSHARRAQIKSISVGSDSWTNELLLRLLTALPGLTELELRGKAVTSLAAFSSVASLRSSLRHLRLRTPSVPRDDVTHLHSLLQLEGLSIAGSFSEPLYAKQLFPFLPPYPKEPLHWLRVFVPRSSDEPVPTPPVDRAAKAAADAEFDARVRAGRVCAAELLNSAQLSCVMQFLDMKAFSIAARSCRSWRAAACLPSAWSLSSPVVVGDGEVAADPLVNGVSPPQWFGSEVYSFDGHGRLMPPKLKPCDSRSRTLHLSASQPHCCPSVLPGLPLWINAKSIVLESSATRGYAPYHGMLTDRESVEADREALLALRQLPRLASLATTVDLRSETAITVLMHMGHKLQSLEVIGLPTSLLGVSALTELRISDGRIDGELSVLHQLRRLCFIRCTFGPNAGSTLRALSRDHALRELNVAESGDLSILLPVLIGESVPLPPNEDAANQPVVALAVPPSFPAQLDHLRLYCNQDVTFSVASVLPLPRLRCLEFHCVSSAVVDLSPLEALVRDGKSLPPIEVLLISTQTHGQLGFVEQLTSLRELRLSDGRAEQCNWSEAPVPELFNPRWAQKLIGLKGLEVIVLSGVQIDPIDVTSLDQLPRLHALTLNRQQSLRVSDLAVLPRIRGLTELQLDNNPHLLLQKRDWLKDIGRQLPGESASAAVETGVGAAAQSMQDVEEQKADTGAESAPAAAAAAASSGPSLPVDADGMLPLLLQCRSLRLLRWSSPAAHLTDAERYTSRHSWVRPPSKMLTSELQQHRINKEYARERQALRMLLSASTEMSVEYGAHDFAYSPASIRTVALPPRSGSIAEAEISAAAESARKLGSSYEYDKVVSGNPSLQAYEDRALIAIEREEELEWRADAERKAAAKPKRRNKY